MAPPRQLPHARAPAPVAGGDRPPRGARLRGPPRAQSLETTAEPSAPATDAHVALAVDVRRALAELSEGDRRLLLARYWADMTQREVADLLGMPDGTAKVRLHRLRARLRPTLREP